MLSCRMHGQYASLDAAATLSQFMVDGEPSPGRFTEIVGSIIARAANGRRRVRIFGEMVALLWADGNWAAAIRLEALWNDLARTHSFSLPGLGIGLYISYQIVRRHGGQLWVESE
jgi:hypothetical protein